MLDIGLIESLNSLNGFKGPEPIIHAKGTGAKGFFVPYMPMSEYTKACFLQDIQQETPVFVKFSLMMGRPGSPDTIRDVRGFSVKFFTDLGTYDMVGSNLPVTFIYNPRKYPDLYKALSPCPKTNIRKPEGLWNFVAANPETMHMITWLYSDKGTVKSYRTMDGHSVHTYKWENSQGEEFWVRYHWLPMEGREETSSQEAEFLAGYDPDVATRDLITVLDEGGTIKYELNVQLISTKQAIENETSLLNPTVIWPEASVPMIKVGKLILNKGIENYREDVENCHFTPGRLIPGISLSREPMLTALTFLSMGKEEYGCKNSYGQRENFTVKTREDSGICSESYYGYDSSLISGQLAWRLRSMDEKEKCALIENMGEELLFTDEKVQRTIVSRIKEANTAMGISLENWLGL